MEAVLPSSPSVADYRATSPEDQGYRMKKWLQAIATA
jgi:hypothetical protein